MGADIKKLRVRIRSIDSTLHLTKAMGLVASSKIRRATDAMNAANTYIEAADEMIARLTDDPTCKRSPYLRETGGERVKLIVIAGDRGLAGGYNNGIFRTVRDMELPEGTEIIPIGKKACDRYGEGYISAETFTYEEAEELAERLCREFVEGEYDRAAVVSTEYINLMTQTPMVTELLPLSHSGEDKQHSDSESAGASFVYEPSEEEIFTSFIPQYIAASIIARVRESFASEVSARRVAMDSAGKNAKQMIDDLQLEYNRARQAIITQEITEIVAGAGE
ncbi:MAG: ATP synthase F1 subunit gamma [Ruminococcus sp.]|nr:ATP synthase F1 subunit gamma [Ruminococcus sp.]